jgi:septum formation protein
MIDQNHDIVLASASPRRAELIQQLGWTPEIVPVDIDESVYCGEEATVYCLRMATEKCAAAQQNIQTTLPIITADTIVVVDRQILGKPKDEDDAVLTLLKLSGREHQVYSAVSVWHAGQTATVLSTNVVKMTDISEAQISAYVATKEPMDKAGSYGIQGYAAMWIECITGSYSSIMGLPLFETTLLLKKVGIMSPLDLLNDS